MATVGYLKSALNLREALVRGGMSHDWLIATNESLITRARNEMTATFLKTDFSHMMWIDADIEFEPAHVADLWNLNAPVAAGTYPMKNDKGWYAAWVNGEIVDDLDQFDGPTEVEFIGTGFMMISRETIEALAEKSPRYQGSNGPVHAIYQTPVVEEHFDSEDYHFCRQWRGLGGKILMEPSIRLLHHGSHAYGSV